jgi:hypothetical protein
MNTFLENNNILIIIISLIWVLPWKGYALWVASKRDQKVWFIIMVIINTFAILEIFYVFFIAKKKPKDILSLFKSKKHTEQK